MDTCDVAIVGAGPYGLSAAAHLRSIGKSVRVFGKCMEFWERHMPAGMFLRSPWVASNLSDPARRWNLDNYKASNNNHLSAPVPLDRFIDYGRWFQRNAAPDVDPRKVVRIEARSKGFSLTLDDGEIVTSHRVVVASGIVPFARRPSEFKGLSPDLASHCSEHTDLRRFAGRRLVVVGGGQSALESAALLHEAGAEVEVVVRNPVVIWLHKKPILHTWPFSAMLYAWPDVGPAVVSHLVAQPNWFRSLPRGLQDKLGPRSIRPAGAQWLKPRVQGVMPITTGRAVKSAVPSGSGVKLTLDDGSERKVNHVLLATGYRVNIALYPFLSEKLLAAIRRVDGYPQLDAGFESSVPGLYFLGAPAAWSFGPLMRFVAGAEFALRALTRKIRENKAGAS
jgi:cation diffusion facilitator CzcD-associated flavoprotein CzcO